jgi:hypothetical protein
VPLQLVWFPVQAHLLLWQVMPPEQAIAQSPQWALSNVRFAHEPEHRVGAVAGHPDVHAKLLPDGLQMGVPPLHTTIQEPQWSLAEKSVSHPSAGAVEQCPKPGWH